MTNPGKQRGPSRATQSRIAKRDARRRRDAKSQHRPKITAAQERLAQEFVAVMSQLIHDLAMNPRHRAARRGWSYEAFLARVYEITGTEEGNTW